MLVASDRGMKSKEDAPHDDNQIPSSRTYSVSAYKVVQGSIAASGANCYGVPIADGVFTIGQCSSFNAEVAALCRGIESMCNYLETKYHEDKTTHPSWVFDSQHQMTLWVFSNNQAVLYAITAEGSTKHNSVIIAKVLKRIGSYMTLHAQHQIAFGWVSSHVDRLSIPGAGHRGRRISASLIVTAFNKEVNRKCTQHLDELMEAPEEAFIKLQSKSVHVSQLQVTMQHNWRRLMLTQSYRGRVLILRKAELDKVRHSYAKTPMLRFMDRDNRRCARLVRVMSNHLLCEEFRIDFNKEGPTHCKCGGGLEICDHILYHCPYWLRSNMLPQTVLNAAERQRLMDENSEDTIRLAELEATNHASWQEVQDFFEWSSLAATFEWSDLVTKALEAEEK